MKHEGVAIIIVALVLIASFIMISNKPSETAKVAFLGKTNITTEIAYTDEEKGKGLMYRDGLPEGSGMLFIFDREGPYTFWMKNMKFPIDIAWVSQHCTVVFLTKGAMPCVNEPCSTYQPDEPIKYAIEVPDGFIEKHGISVGDEIAFSWKSFVC